MYLAVSNGERAAESSEAKTHSPGNFHGWFQSDDLAVTFAAGPLFTSVGSSLLGIACAGKQKTESIQKEETLFFPAMELKYLQHNWK